MEPIINPWLIWALQTCNGLKIMLIIACIFLGVCIIVSIVGYCESVDADDEKKCKKMRNGFIIATIFAALLAVAIPDKTTATHMVVASYITEDNLNKATVTVQEAIDYIFDKIEDISNNKKEN